MLQKLLKDWLTSSSIDNTRLFDVIEYTEKSNWKDNSIVDILKIHLQENTVEKSFLDEVAKILDWDEDEIYRTFVAQSQPPGDLLRKGKFGEILHSEILLAFQNLEVPVKKFQYQITPASSLLGTDLILFKRIDEKIEAIFYVETKVRTTRNTSALSEAYAELVTAQNEKIPSYLKFILKELYKEDKDLFKQFLEFGVEITPNDNFRIGGIYDSATWSDTSLTNLSNVHDRSMLNLTIDVIKINSLNELVNKSYEKLGEEIV